jgi:hypothetical protein
VRVRVRTAGRKEGPVYKLGRYGQRQNAPKEKEHYETRRSVRGERVHETFVQIQEATSRKGVYKVGNPRYLIPLRHGVTQVSMQIKTSEHPDLVPEAFNLSRGEVGLTRVVGVVHEVMDGLKQNGVRK